MLLYKPDFLLHTHWKGFVGHIPTAFMLLEEKVIHATFTGWSLIQTYYKERGEIFTKLKPQFILEYLIYYIFSNTTVKNFRPIQFFFTVLYSLLYFIIYFCPFKSICNCIYLIYTQLICNVLVSYFETESCLNGVTVGVKILK